MVVFAYCSNRFFSGLPGTTYLSWMVMSPLCSSWWASHSCSNPAFKIWEYECRICVGPGPNFDTYSWEQLPGTAYLAISSELSLACFEDSDKSIDRSIDRSLSSGNTGGHPLWLLEEDWARANTACDALI